ncbi:MAG TPA: ABC transporter permease [Candidatus Thermoplasmatota archaeon]|nr:ABC transporter permease [Candidatus Thermoplasmatota archaeon]
MSVTGFGRAAWASFIKSGKVAFTYSPWIINRVLGPFLWVSLAVYAYTGISTEANVQQRFHEVGVSGDFTTFLILGQTVFSFFTAMNWRSGFAIQRERWAGTWELILLSPVNRFAFLTGEALFGIVDSGWSVLLAMAVAAFAFGAGFTLGSPLLAFVALTLTLLAMVSLGFFFASFYVLSRSAGPLSMAIQAPVRFFSGTQFPVGALPAALQAVSYAIPITWGLGAVRATLTGEPTWSDLAPTLGLLVAFSVVFLTVGAILLKRMEHRSKVNGTVHLF